MPGLSNGIGRSLLMLLMGLTLIASFAAPSTAWAQEDHVFHAEVMGCDGAGGASASRVVRRAKSRFARTSSSRGSRH